MLRSLAFSATGVLVAVLAPWSTAQGGSIRAGNVDYAVNDIPDSHTSTNGFANFTARRTQDPDTLRHHWWYFRIAGDPREYPLNTGDTNGDGSNTQGFNETYNADQATLVWSDVDERGLLSAIWTIRVFTTGNNKGTAVSQVELTNISGSPVTVDMFAYAMWDLCLADDPHHIVTGTGFHQNLQPDPAQCPINYFTEMRAVNADHWEIAISDPVTPPTSLLTRLLDNQVTTLSDSRLPWNPLDHGNHAFQWQNRTINPGQSETVTLLLTHNYTVCDQPAGEFVYGSGSTGSNGVPALNPVNPPILGIKQPNGFDVIPRMRVTNGAPNAIGSLIAGIGRANVQIGNVTLLTNSIADVPIVLDASGVVGKRFPIPLQSGLCGAQLNFQALILDAGVSGAFPVSHTNGLEWTLGGY